MIHVSTTDRNSFLFPLYTLLFLLILITLALSGPLSHAEPPSELILSHEESLLLPTIVTDICPPVAAMFTRTIPAIPTQTQAGSRCVVFLEESGYIMAVI